MNKTVAIFGAAGKLGRRALALLAERGWPVRALVHKTPVAGPGVTSIQGSIADPGAVEETVRYFAVDGLQSAIEAGATACIQPGGSIRDEEVIAAADAAGMAMVFTGHRHFRH